MSNSGAPFTSSTGAVLHEEIRNALLLIPFHNTDGDEAGHQASLALLKTLEVAALEVGGIHLNYFPNARGGGIPLQQFTEKLEANSMVIADLASTNHSVTLELALACLYRVNVVMLVPSAEETKVSVYLQPHGVLPYDPSEVQAVYTALSGGQSWSDLNGYKIHTLLSTVFTEIKNRTFNFGMPLLATMSNSPFRQIASVKELMFDERRANSKIYIQARGVTETDSSDELKAVVRENVARGVFYTYLLPDEKVHRVAFKRIKDEVTDAESRDRFKCWFADSDLIENEITFIDPGIPQWSAYMLDVFESSSYALKLDENSFRKSLTRFKNLLKTPGWVRPEE
jgi:hypothetical protein